jgi:hypothetical protein
MEADQKWPGKGEEALPAGGEFLVIVAQNGKGKSAFTNEDNQTDQYQTTNQIQQL